eukprot:6242533-Lingulodinium_polyedra.AAC.1
MDKKAIRVTLTCSGSQEGNRAPYGLSVAEFSGDRCLPVGPAYCTCLSDLFHPDGGLVLRACRHIQRL